MQKTACFLLLALTLLASACSMNPNTQGTGESYLQGEWQQDSTVVQKQLMTYSLYHFKFTCDSFFVQQQTYSKINYGADTCMNKGHWTEYMRGTYTQQLDTVHLKGIFCNADFTSKDPNIGCFRSGVYEEFFKVNKKSDSLIQFSGTASVIPVNLRLTKKLTCHVKPL
ncbi:MAG TPA: fumarate hydratase [Mucilaginibacter sp.]